MTVLQLNRLPQRTGRAIRRPLYIYVDSGVKRPRAFDSKVTHTSNIVSQNGSALLESSARNSFRAAVASRMSCQIQGYHSSSRIHTHRLANVELRRNHRIPIRPRHNGTFVSKRHSASNKIPYNGAPDADTASALIGIAEPMSKQMNHVFVLIRRMELNLVPSSSNASGLVPDFNVSLLPNAMKMRLDQQTGDFLHFTVSG